MLLRPDIFSSSPTILLLPRSFASPYSGYPSNTLFFTGPTNVRFIFPEILFFPNFSFIAFTVSLQFVLSTMASYRNSISAREREALPPGVAGAGAVLPSLVGAVLRFFGVRFGFGVVGGFSWRKERE